MKFCVAPSCPSSKLAQPRTLSFWTTTPRAYKQANVIITEDWPVCFPDLNVIEHAWDMLQRALYVRQPAPNNLAVLSVAVQEEWNHLDQNQLRRLAHSVQNRCREVTQASGGYNHH